MRPASLLSALTAIGSAHAGEALAPDALLRRLLPADDSPEEQTRAAEFRRRFNGPVPAEAWYPDAATAVVARKFEDAATRGKESE
jgi:hypothetical protein